MTLPALDARFEWAKRYASLIAGDGPALLASFDGEPVEHRYGTIEALWPWVEAHTGVYFTVNETRGARRRRQDVVRIRAIWVDDDVPGPMRTDWPLAPSIVVESSPGKFHYLWQTSHDNLDEFDAVMLCMERVHGCDPGAKDASRVLGLPGTVNPKTGTVRKLLDAPGHVYTWAQIVAAFPPIEVEKHEGGGSANEPERADSALRAIPNTGAARLDREAWLRYGMAYKAAGGTLETFLAWTADPSKERETRASWKSFKTDGGIGPGTLYKAARPHGWIEDPAVQRAHCDYMLGLEVNVESIARAADPDRQTALRLMPDLRAAVEGRLREIAVEGFEVVPGEASPLPAFERDKVGRILATPDNVAHALGDQRVCGVQVARDTFQQSVMLSEDGKWRPVRDEDYFDLRRRFELGGFRSISKDLIRDAMHSVALLNRFDSACQWLAPLVWDGRPRVAEMLPRYFGTADTAYTRAVGRYVMTAAAGRVMQPGVKADMVPVAVGPQGAGKSMTIRAISPTDEAFAEIDLGARDDDTARQLRGKLIVESGELKGLRNRDAEATKAFLSAQVDRWVPKYMEHEVCSPRRFVLFGSTNRHDFLVDETGNRRWLPFEVGKCDPAAMERDREQLWAEAREMFQRDGVHYAEAERLARAHHASYLEIDPWEEVIANYLETCESVTTDDLLGKALNKLPRERSRADQMRAGAILRRLGWVRLMTMRQGVRAWRFIRTTCTTSAPPESIEVVQ